MEKLIKIKINEEEIEVEPGTSVLAASMKAGLRHMHLCGGRGLCSTCRVRIIEGADQLSEMESFERISLRGHLSFSENVRLACQAKVAGPVQVKTLFPTIGRLNFTDPKS
jgi:adenylate cyclase